jgi:phospholipid/cholesterol/gamma-HCH transport system permease protein
LVPQPDSEEAEVPDGRLTRLLDGAGEYFGFMGATFRSLPTSLRFTNEILRQAAQITLSSTLVVWAFLTALGIILGEIGFYLLAQLGAQSYLAVFTAAGSVKASAPVYFGMITAGKIGCGFAAELGAMRINEEIDATTVMGVPAHAFLVGTRVLAFMIVAPFLWITSLMCCFAAQYITAVTVLKGVSPGGYNDVFWSFTPLTDVFVTSFLWSYVMGIITMITACYYGYTVKGGPVQVGDATAKSMTANVIFVTAFGGGVLFQLCYGTSVVLPIGN